MPLTITGSLCNNNLTMTMSVADAVSYQWYQDGIAMIGFTVPTMVLSDNMPDVEGIYELVATTPSGCVVSEAFDVVIPYFFNDLGEEIICQGDTIVFGAFFLTTAGTFQDNAVATQEGAQGCDSIVQLTVIVQQDEIYFQDTSACLGTEIIFGTQVLTMSGTYEEPFVSSAGCDSIVRLTAAFDPLDPFITDATICLGDSYEFRGMSYEQEGTFDETVTSAAGCDSVFVLNLEVINPVDSELQLDICQGGEVSYEGVVYDTDGFHPVTLVAASGCDSIVYLTIMQLPPDEYFFDEELCQGAVFEYGEISATMPGIYQTPISTPGVCDSLITFNLTFTDPTPAVEEVTICQGETYTWNGEDYDTAGTYTFTDTSGDCDILHQLELEVTQPVYTPVMESICAGGSVVIAGETYDEPGNFEIDLLTADGCDSILQVTIVEDAAETYEWTESICRGEIFTYGTIEESTSGTYTTTVMTPGVCDSMITIELTVLPPDPIVTNEVICQGLTFEWNGTMYHEPGTYENLVTADGVCDELYHLVLEVTAPEVISESLRLCPSELPFEFGDIKADTTGVYTTTVSEAGLCDLTYEYDITVLENSESLVNDNFCEGDTYVFHDIETMIAGTFTTTIENEAGCDSTITLVLAANALVSSQVSGEMCPGEAYIYNGEEIYDEGDHQFTFQDQNGCDSLVTLTLTHSNLVMFTYDYSICEGENIQVFGLNADTTGQYQILLDSGGGCDSLITVNLEVNNHTNEQMDPHICAGESYTLPNGEVVQEADTYVITLANANSKACDSTIIVNLAVIEHEPTELDMQICEGESYDFGGITFTNAGTYPLTQTSSFGCDSLINLNLVVEPLGRRQKEELICPGDEYVFNDIITSVAGTFETTITNSAGCDSIITVIVTIEDADALLDLGEDKVINIGASVDVIPEYVSPSLTNFEWFDENGEFITDESELYAFSPVEDTWVELFAQNENGCDVRERIHIDVELIIDIFVPNVITPTVDDSNKYFTIGANESVVGIKELYIYDRWGELMFSDTHDGNLDSYLGWDGTFKNEVVMHGVYAYLVVFDIIDGTTVQKKGDLTVLK